MKTIRRLLIGTMLVLMAGMVAEGMFFNRGYVNRYSNQPRPELAGASCSTDDDCASSECCTKYGRCRGKITTGLCYPYKIARKETCDCGDGDACDVFPHLKWKEIYNQAGSCRPKDQVRNVELKTYGEWGNQNPSQNQLWLGNKFRNQIGYASGRLHRGRRSNKQAWGQTAP